jgi:hypothetical protein
VEGVEGTVSREHNEQIMRTYLGEVGAKGRLELIPEIAHEDIFDEGMVNEGLPPGREALVTHVKNFFATMPEPTFTIRKIMTTDDEVMAWWTAEGKVDGAMRTYYAFSFFTITDGKISRYRYFVANSSDSPPQRDHNLIFDSTAAEDIPAPLPSE